MFCLTSLNKSGEIMKKTILITGSTDGIGLETAKSLIELGHHVLIHGRSKEKLNNTLKQLKQIDEQAQINAYEADLSDFDEVRKLANHIKKEHGKLDVLINNAGVFVVPNKVTKDGLDVRYVVNTIAPYLLTEQLLPIMDSDARVVNLSSAAQAPINPNELSNQSALSDGEVYAKSKLAITMWSFNLAASLGDQGPSIIAVNPASMLGSKMVNTAYGVEGKSLKVGSDILVRAATSDEFSNVSGRYFDNDYGQFRSPHPDANNNDKTKKIVQVIKQIINDL